MSSTTTRYLINRQRRLAATARPAAAGPVEVPAVVAELEKSTEPPARRWRWRRPAVLALAAVLLAGFGAGAAARMAALRADPAARNLALTDPVRTSEVKGTLSQAVNTLFSYNYADTARTDTAAKTLLVGNAVQQYATMLAEVRKQAPQQKLVLTTTVTDSGVELIDGDRARLLVFADQRNTSTADSAKPARTSYAAAMFAVDAVRQGGGWRIANIDTFNQ
ncbi:hypothetical protein [Kitasatospora sp. MAP5-34]|uniref:hypothetical protein n=1 Tax=Kitasatospora sp. MAP5-34 TaxID=3035102 RepID=UPI0024772CE8|nr:hypothetical protein [Kitasatospora sp. MAP5-34]MDH6577248.1 Mce-associated membrane protein [Kitasatospora sp. MAP5-34]